MCTLLLCNIKYRSTCSFKRKETNIYFAIEHSLREISFIINVRERVPLRALMTQKSYEVGMRNAILRNHLKEARKGF